MSYYDDCNLPTISTLGGADLLTVFSQENGSKRNISAANARTFMQDGTTVANGLLGLSSIYELYQTSTSVFYTGLGAGVPVPLNVGLSTTRVLPAGRTSISIVAATGEFVFQRDCQAVRVSAYTLYKQSSSNHYHEFHVKITGTSATYIAPIAQASYNPVSGVDMHNSFSATLCNPNNANNMIKAGERLSFYFVPLSNPSTTYNFTNQIFTVQTMDGI